MAANTSSGSKPAGCSPEERWRSGSNHAGITLEPNPAFGRTAEPLSIISTGTFSPKGNVLAGAKKSKSKVKNSPLSAPAKVIALINRYNFSSLEPYDSMALKLLNISVVMGKKLFLLISALLLLFSILPAHGQEGGLFASIGIQPVRDKKKAPPCCLESLTGEKVQLSDLKDKIIFLNFWATWCGPCKEEMPSIETLYQRYKERDFIFLTISVDYEGSEPVRKFIEKHRYRFPVLLDPKGKTLDLFEVNKIPTTLIIDRKGKMMGRVIGPRNWSRPEVFSLIDQMLNAGPRRTISSKN